MEFLGINLEALEIQSCSLTGQYPDVEETKREEDFVPIPPSLLIPYHTNEPFRVDYTWPPHVRATGQQFPQEATITKDESLRFPLGYILAELASNQETRWSWNQNLRQRDIKTEEALAELVSSYLDTGCFGLNTSPVLVIPDSLKESSQQEIIDSLRRKRIKIQFLWRPVAASMAWCERFASKLEQIDEDSQDKCLGHILSLHLGFTDIEITKIEILSHHHKGIKYYIPARKRPLENNSYQSFGLNLLQYNIQRMLKHSHIDISAEYIWELMWSSPLPVYIYENLCGREAKYFDYDMLGLGSIVDRELEITCLGLMKEIHSSDEDYLEKLSYCKPSYFQGIQFIKWLSTHRSSNSLGLVITGPLASAEYLDKTFGEFFAHEIVSDDSNLLVEGVNCEKGLLARETSKYAAKLDAGLPTYMDTLPELSIAVTINGNPTFHTLTQKDYVPGGQDWKPDDKITGFSVSAGNVQIPLNHEEFDTVREANVKVPEKGTDNLPVHLDVMMKPANGNASVEVVPENDRYAFGGQRIYVEWKRMKDTGQKPDKYLSDKPRICPVHWPRKSNYEAWVNMRDLFERFNRPSIRKILAKINRSSGDDRPLGSESLDSERFTDYDRKVLATSIDKTKSMFNSCRNRDEKIDVLKMLSYTYASGMDDVLSDVMHQKGVALIDFAELNACGMCLRNPLVINKFAELLNKRLNNSIHKTKNWTRAFAHILRFREEATKEISSELCKELSEHFYNILNQEYKKASNKLDYIFRYSALAMVLLLRRRIFDNVFLPPDSDIAVKTKRLFKRIIKDENIEILGGAINMRKEMKKYIDYIDRKGHGLLLWAE